MKIKSLVLASAIAVSIPSCMSGNVVKDVDFPATPVDMTKLTKMGKACFSRNIAGTSGNGSIIAAAKNGGIKTVYMVEYGTEFEAGGFVQKQCTYVYGD